MIDPTSRIRERDWTPEETEEQPDPAASPEARLAAWIHDGDDDRCVRTPAAHPGAAWPLLEHVDHGRLFIKGPKDVAAIDPNDVSQGAIGDCNLLASMRALAQTPDGRARIGQMIHERKDATGQTVYDVTLHVCDGDKLVPKTFTVASDFVHGHAKFGDKDEKTNEVELWPAVVEAAYAQAHGGMDEITKGGSPATAMESLTGKKAEAYVPARRMHDIEDLARECSAKMVVLSTQRESKTFGLSGHHAYVLEQIRLAQDGKLYLVLGNPWGKEDPKAIPADRFTELFSEVTVGER
jgi:hypothetical protein